MELTCIRHAYGSTWHYLGTQRKVILAWGQGYRPLDLYSQHSKCGEYLKRLDTLPTPQPLWTIPKCIKSWTLKLLSEPNKKYMLRINYYSSSNPAVTYFGIKTGNADNDNRNLLVNRRFEMAAVGDEKVACIPIVGEDL